MKKLLCLLALLAVPASAQLSTATPAQIKFQQTDSADTRLRKLEIVRKAIATGSSGVASFNTRTGAVTLTSGDVTTALTFTPLSGNQTITLSGAVSGSGATAITTTLGTSVVGLSNMANVATGTLFYRKTAGTGAPEVQTLATLKTDLGLTGTNSGDQTITLTGDVTGSGTGSFATTLANTVVTAGSYTNANITVDAKGRLTAASNGSAGGGTTTNALTMNNGGSGAASGSTFNGASAVTLSYNTLGAAPLASPTFTGKVTTAASASGGAGFNLPHGAAPSSPANGDLWTTTSGLFAQINSATKQFATGTGTATGTNTGDQTITLTGDVTGSGTGSFATTLATVNSNTGSFGSSSAIPVITVNGKGLITAVTTAAPSGGSGWTELTLASDYTNSTVTQTTISDGTTLLGFTPTAGANWEAEGTILIQTATSTVLPMCGFTVNAPGTGGYGSGMIQAVGATVTSVVVQAATWTTTTVSTNLPAGGVAAANTPYIVKYWLRGHNGTSTNAINLTCASETAGTTITVKTASQLRYKLT